MAAANSGMRHEGPFRPHRVPTSSGAEWRNPKRGWYDFVEMQSAAPRHRYTFRDYLDVEESSRTRHEFYDGEIYAMAGGTPEHAALCAALLGRLVEITRGGPCRAYSSDLRVRIRRTGLATYPDAAVICGPVERDPESPSHVTNPSVLFEVLSPGTEEYDRREKREHYQQIDSLREYVVLAQDRKLAEVWRRTADGTWPLEQDAAGRLLKIETLDGDIDLDELYSSAGIAVS